MGKSRKLKPPCYIIENGPVTRKQVAYMVDCYLEDNGFTETRNHFRNEASSFLSSAPLNDVPKNILPLGEVLNEYVLLKEHKTAVEKEKIRLENLMAGMKNVMNAYAVAEFGNAQYGTQNGIPVSLLCDKRVYPSTPSTSLSISRKRKGPEISVGAPRVSRKARIATTQEKSTVNGYAQYSTQHGRPTSLLRDIRVGSRGISTPSTSHSVSGKGKGPEVCIGAPLDTAQEKSAANGYAQYSTQNGMPVSLLHDKRGDLLTPSTSQSISGSHEVSVGLGIDTAQEKSAANAEFELEDGDLFTKVYNSNLFTSGGSSSYEALLDNLGLDNEGAASFNAPPVPNQVMPEYRPNVNQLTQETDMNTQRFDDADIFAKFIADVDESEFCQMLQVESDPKDKMT